MIALERKLAKSKLAESLGISRSLLYYRHKQPEKDWVTKVEIERALREHTSYGHKRLALHLRLNKKRVLRVMKLFGIKPYRRRGRKPPKKATGAADYPNLLLAAYPYYPHRIWASDFTYLPYRGKFLYLATVIDLYTREIVGLAVSQRHDCTLVTQALLCALHNHPRASILHSDHGSEYCAADYQDILAKLGINPSMAGKGCPWENGYQESFYSQFKVDLGDPERFTSLGELIAEIYETIRNYNHKRIHSALKMSPMQFARQLAPAYH